jgi:hypothetical protein
MSTRFHNKYHRHNHHTVKIDDPRYPDASHDPIASPDSPFLGPFVLIGPLSGYAIPSENVLENFDLSAAPPAASFYAPAVSAIAIQAEGSVNITGDLDIGGTITAGGSLDIGGTITAGGDITTSGTLFAANISFQGSSVISTFQTPLTANGDFLLLTVNGQQRALRLWSII